MKRYAIWNKQDPVITPIGEVLSAPQWIERYPIAGIPSITVVCAAGEINGAYFGTLGQMVSMYEQQGCDFSGCATEDAKLAAIEAFENAQAAAERAAAEAAAAEAAKANETVERQVTALEAIANGATSESTAAMNALLTGEEV